MSVLTGPWSYSRATTCALELYKQRVLKAPPEPRPDRLTSIDRRAYGSMLHDGAEYLLCAILNRHVPRVDDSRRVDANVIHDLQQHMGVNKHDRQRLAIELSRMPFYRHMAGELSETVNRLELFYNLFRMAPDIDVEDRDSFIRTRCLGTELRLAVDGRGQPCGYYECPPDGFRGIIDYAEDGGDGLLIIRDFKNRPAIYSRAELLADEQLSGYAMLCSSQWPQFKRFNVGIYYFEFGYEQAVDIDYEAILANVARTRARIAQKEALAENEIGPQPGFGKCQYCDYLDSCAAGRQLTDQSPTLPTDAESAARLAQWLVVTEEKVAAVKAGLKAYVSEFGPVAVDDKTSVGMALVERTEWDKNRALRILKGLGEKLSDYTRLDTDAVKKLMKNDDKARALAPARTVVSKTQFEIFRADKRKPAAPKPRAEKKADNNNVDAPRVRGRVKSKARGSA